MALDLFGSGEILGAEKLNQIVNNINSIETTLNNKVLQEEILLWQGNIYLDGATNYTLWSASQHRHWDYVRIYVAHDSQWNPGTNGHSFEINCGPQYVFGHDTIARSTLCTTWREHYRRICVSTVGLNVVDGAGSGWYLTKVVGVIKKRI